ncbi:MerR family transcriptional regulator, partial [Streptomyces sp. YIM 98790]|uniref:MerR family transcriptional regulator n=1 Tax=Streptomyces sp. YIM 98790 TaxID=2689077 RepID=UPI001407CA99
MSAGAEAVPAPQGGPGLTTSAVARRFAVAPTTLRSWDRRYGIGPAGHRSGRHRRWRAEDIAVVEHMCRLVSAGVPPGEAARRAREHRKNRQSPGGGPPGENGNARAGRAGRAGQAGGPRAAG